MNTLQIIDGAYRATLEEQDDPVIWLTRVIRGAGAELALLLRGAAVNYAVGAQHPAGLLIGDWEQRHPPRLPADLEALHDKGVAVYAVREDVMERGIEPRELVGAVSFVSRAELGAFLGRFERIWHW